MDTLGIIREMEADPALRAQLRSVLLSDELLALPDTVARIAADLKEFGEKTDRRLTNLEGDVGTMKGDVGTLKENVAVLTDDVGTLKDNVAVLTDDVGTLKGDVGTLKGDGLELRLRDRPGSHIGFFLRKARALDIDDVLTEDQALDDRYVPIFRLDAVFEGTVAGNRVLAATEASWVAHVDDVERAVERAKLLAEATGRPVLPLVVSREDPGEVVVARARESHVALLVIETQEVRNPGEPLAS
jgi:hypothetical protein